MCVTWQGGEQVLNIKGGGICWDTLRRMLARCPRERLSAAEALQRLAAMDPGYGKLVELRFFAGLSIVEAAEVLGVSRATADRNWAFARAWLFKELNDARPESTQPGGTA